MGCLSFFIDCVLDFGHLSVDKVLIGFVLGEQGQKDVACVIVSVLCNKLFVEDSLVYECHVVVHQTSWTLTHRGDSGKMSMRAIVTTAKRHCKANGKRNCAWLLTYDIP